MAPKKGGVNEKVEAARDRKAASKSALAKKEETQKEEAYWAQYDNPKGKKDAKKEEQEKKLQEAASRKAELRRLVAEEEAAMNAKKKAVAARGAPAKVTARELALIKEKEDKQRSQEAQRRVSEGKRLVHEDEYAKAIEVENTNRAVGDGVDARNVTAALSQLSTSDELPADMHPEKRAKAMWEAYYAEQLPILKEEKPGLRLMQYKSMIFDRWARSPLNPRNQMK